MSIILNALRKSELERAQAAAPPPDVRTLLAPSSDPDVRRLPRARASAAGEPRRLPWGWIASGALAVVIVVSLLSGEEVAPPTPVAVDSQDTRSPDAPAARTQSTALKNEQAPIRETPVPQVQGVPASEPAGGPDVAQAPATAVSAVPEAAANTPETKRKTTPLPTREVAEAPVRRPNLVPSSDAEPAEGTPVVPLRVESGLAPAPAPAGAATPEPAVKAKAAPTQAPEPVTSPSPESVAAAAPKLAAAVSESVPGPAAPKAGTVSAESEHSEPTLDSAPPTPRQATPQSEPRTQATSVSTRDATPDVARAAAVVAGALATETPSVERVVEATSANAAVDAQLSTKPAADTEVAPVETAGSTATQSAALAPASRVAPEAPAATEGGNPPIDTKLAADPYARLQTYRQLPKAVRDNIPELKVYVHVFDPSDDRRFVVTNRGKFTAGDQITGDLMVEAILPDGLVLRFKSVKFRVFTR